MVREMVNVCGDKEGSKKMVPDGELGDNGTLVAIMQCMGEN